jgi:hypothetical protein
MGSIARAHARKQARTLAKHPTARLPVRLDPEANYGVVAGWCATDADLPEARKDTHDQLIALMGDNRAGPVQWQWWEGRDATETLEAMKADTTDFELSELYRRMSGLLREQGGILLVAMAPAKS